MKSIQVSLIAVLLSLCCYGQSPVAGTGVGMTDNSGHTSVQQDPTQLLFEDFGQAFTQGKWNATAGGTGSAPTSAVDAAGTTLSAGATLNGFSALSSVPLFEPAEPGFIRVQVRAQLLSNVSVTTYNFWGLANLPASSTIANPVVDGCGFDVLQGTAKLMAVCYQGTSGTSGARVVIQDLSAATGNGGQPADLTAVHKYDLLFSGALAYWYIDGKTVASMLTGANGPNNNTLSVSAVSVSNSGTANTLSLAAVVVGDTSKRETNICDPLNEWLCAKLGSAATESAAINSTSLLTEKGSRWQVNNSGTAASGVQGTISKSAGAAGVRHVVDCISFAADAAAGVTAANVLLNVRDGATGAGTVIWQYALSFPTAAALGIQEVVPAHFCGLNIIGTAATAMTIEFSAAVTGSIQSVNMTGYDVQ